MTCLNDASAPGQEFIYFGPSRANYYLSRYFRGHPDGSVGHMDGSVTTFAANQRHIQKTGVGGGARMDTFGLLNDG